MSDARSNPIVELDSITRVYRKDGDRNLSVTAVDDVTLRIQAGEFSAIVGPSGSGKTTLLNIVGGLDQPTSGSVVVAGSRLGELDRNELADFRLSNVGFVFQAYNLLPVLTAEENAEFGLLLQGVSKVERRRRVKDVLGEMGFEPHLLNRRPGELSGGQQQRVAVARALVSEPKLILADEPTANLDTETGGQLLDIMKRLNEETGVTFLFSTHDTRVMERAKRLIELQDGRIVSDENVSGNP